VLARISYAPRLGSDESIELSTITDYPTATLSRKVLPMAADLTPEAPTPTKAVDQAYTVETFPRAA